jgi:hypothetical protein
MLLPLFFIVLFIGLVVNTLPFCSFVFGFVASPPLHGLIIGLVGMVF